MKFSRNNILSKISENRYVIANTLTRSIIEVDSDSLLDLKERDSDSLLKLTAEEYKNCIDMGFIVPDFLNENEFLNHVLSRERLNPTDLISYLMYSSHCNFACKYCYEIGQIEEKTMETNTVENLLEWYKYRLENGDFKGLYLFLYGGEPLLFLDFFLKFLEKIKEVTDRAKVTLKTGLFTNGYLLSSEKIKKLLPYNLQEINVTFDGSPQVHNQLRPLKNGDVRKTFDVILKNLIEVSSLDLSTEINCRISFCKSNIDSISHLLKIIKEKDIAKNIKPYFSPIIQTLSQVKDASSFCSKNALVLDDEIADAYLVLYKQAAELGFRIPDFITLGPCMIYSIDSGVVSPEGKIYKCLDMVGFPNLEVGDVSLPMYYHSNYYNMVNGSRLNYCLGTDCPFVPICGGGCAMEPLLKSGDYNKIVCHRAMLERIHNLLYIEKYS